MRRSLLPLALLILLLAGTTVSADEPSPISKLPFTNVRELVFMPENRHTLITGGTGSDELFELDRDAKVVRRKDGLAGAGDLIVEDDRIYVALEDVGEIVELERPSLDEVARYATDPFEAIGWISRAGDNIYFSYGCRGGDPGLGILDLSTGLARDSHVNFEHHDCVNHAVTASGTELFTWEWWGIKSYALDPLLPVLLREREITYLSDAVTDGRFAYVITPRSLEKIDLATFETVSKETIPEGGTSIALDATQRYVGVVGPSHGDVMVYRTSDLDRVRRFSMGLYQGAQAVLFPKARKLIYASNYYDDFMTVAPSFDREEVIATRRMELEPVAGSGYVAWASGSPSRPGWENVYLKGPSGKVKRLRTPGAEAWPGSIDGDKMIYQRARGRTSDLWLYDITTRKSRRLPRAVNSRGWEWRPSMSGRWILFSRMPRGGSRNQIVLVDRRTGRSRILFRAGSKRTISLADQVNGDHVVWTTCSRTCSVYKHNIARNETRRIPNRWPLQFSAAVDDDGTLYYAKARRGCGNRAGIVRHPPGEKPRLIASVHDGTDIDRLHLEPGSNPPRIYYTRYSCHDLRPQTDIFFFEDP